MIEGCDAFEERSVGAVGLGIEGPDALPCLEFFPGEVGVGGFGEPGVDFGESLDESAEVKLAEFDDDERVSEGAFIGRALAP